MGGPGTNHAKHDGNGALAPLLAPGLFRGELPPGTPKRLAGCLKTQWKRYRKGLKRCQEKFSEGAVHKSRIETRRLLSLVELLGPFLRAGRLNAARRALKRHLDTFDDLRDTHVQLLAVRKMACLFAVAPRFCGYLRKRERRFTHQTRRNIKCIKTKRLGKLIDCCRQDVKDSCSEHHPREANARLLNCLTAAFERTRQLKTRIDPQDTQTIHHTRVAFKKFRYMVETLSAEWPLRNPKLIEQMQTYQTLMGEIQDAEVLLRAWEKFARKKQVPAEDAGHFEAELRRARQHLIQRYLEAADQLLKFQPQPGEPASRPLLLAKPARPRASPTAPTGAAAPRARKNQ